MSENKTDDQRLPVTVLSGFLGAGKTTLLQTIFDACLADNALPAPDPYQEALAWVRQMFGPQLAAEEVI